jgi:hypothetical protein
MNSMGKQQFTEFEYLDFMPCNTEVNIDILTQNKPIRLKTKLIGVHCKKYIILELGQDKNWKLANGYIIENTSVIVRILNGFDPNANVVAFRSNISKLMTPLHNWIVIYYPKELEKVALRQSGRLPVSIPSLLSQGGSNKEPSECTLEGDLIDISIKGGGFIGTENNKISLEDKCTLTLLDKSNGESIYIVVIIKNRQVLDAENKLIQYGFILDSDYNTAEIFVQKIIRKQLNQF